MTFNPSGDLFICDNFQIKVVTAAALATGGAAVPLGQQCQSIFFHSITNWLWVLTSSNLFRYSFSSSPTPLLTASVATRSLSANNTGIRGMFVNTASPYFVEVADMTGGRILRITPTTGTVAPLTTGITAPYAIMRTAAGKEEKNNNDKEREEEEGRDTGGRGRRMEEK